TDLDGPAGGVGDFQRGHGEALVYGHTAVGEEDLTGYEGVGCAAHGIGLVAVKSLVPSGKLASICTWSSISATPSMTSSRLRMWRPDSMSSATVLPSRAPSYRAEDMTAVASGRLSSRPRSRRS